MENVNYLLFRIINGYYYSDYRGKRLKVTNPTATLKYRAERYVNHVKEQIKFGDSNDWLSEQKRMMFLNYNQIWDNDKQKELDRLIKNQDQIKVALYLGYKVKQNREMLKKELGNNREQTARLQNLRDTYIEHTKRFFLEKQKNLFMLKNTVYKNDKLFFKNKSLFMLEDFSYHYISEKIFSQIPILIRSPEWATYWNVAKSKIISCPTRDWNDEQIYAVNASLALDNIIKHPEAPNDEILKDPDATEGWVIHQNRKEERDKNLQSAEDKLKGKSQEANEVFFMADNIEEQRDIYDLNDPANRKFIREVEKFAEENKGEHKWVDIPVVQQRKVREKEGKL